MSWRVLVEPAFPLGALAIRVAARHSDSRYVVLSWPGQPELVTIEAPIGTAMPLEPAHTLHIPEEIGPALLDALSSHYGGATDVRSLRRDYDAERARVDRMIAHLTKERS